MNENKTHIKGSKQVSILGKDIVVILDKLLCDAVDIGHDDERSQSDLELDNALAMGLGENAGIGT
jgi:hypothetical protein